MDPVLLFFVAAIALAASELLSGELTLLMLGGGALVGAGVGFLGAPLWAMVAVFCVVSLLMLVVVKPIIRKQLTDRPKLDISHNALIGERGIVLEDISTTGGQIKAGGSIWSARTALDGVALPKGSVVHVVDIDGATAVVAPTELT